VTVSHDRATTAKHEAAHCAALVMLGRLPVSVSADWPEAGSAGVMEIAWGEEGISRESARDVAISILMGPLIEGKADWPPRRPPDMSASGDEGQLGALARYLKLDERGWDALITQADTLAQSPEFLRLVELIARALELKDELNTDDLRWLLGERTLRQHGLATQTEERE
jgi:hypothetical protein